MKVCSVSRWLSLLAFVLLTGCATSIATRTPDGLLKVEIPNDSQDGYLLVRVVSTRPISLLNPKWQHVALMSAQGVRHEIPDVTPMSLGFAGDSTVITESLHFGRLPPGEYDFANAGSIGPGPGLLMALVMSDHAALDRKMPRLRIEKGRLANLGTIVFAPSADKEPAQLVLLDGARGRAESLRALQDDSARAALPPEGGGWQRPNLGEPEPVDQARALVAMISAPSDAASNGHLVVGSHLGEVFERTGTSQWRDSPLSELIRVTFATRWTDGTWIAGSEFGRYATKQPEGNWRVHAIPGERGQVTAIQKLPTGEILFLLSDRAKGVRALVMPELVPAAAAPKVLDVDLKDADEAKLPAMLLDHPEAVLIARNVPGFRREVVLTRIDKRSLAVSTTRENFWVSGWQALPNGQIQVNRMNGLTNYFTLSTDAGRSWKNTDLVLPHGVRWADSSTAYAINPTPGFNTVSNQVTRTTDAGKTWTPIGKAFTTRDLAARIIYADDKEILAQGGFAVFSSIDMGKTWTTTFPRETGSQQAKR